MSLSWGMSDSDDVLFLVELDSWALSEHYSRPSVELVHLSLGLRNEVSQEGVAAAYLLQLVTSWTVTICVPPTSAIRAPDGHKVGNP